MKGNNELKYLNYQSEFDHHYACWATNHNGWRKMKKLNRKLAKKKIRNTVKKNVEDELAEVGDLNK